MFNFFRKHASSIHTTGLKTFHLQNVITIFYANSTIANTRSKRDRQNCRYIFCVDEDCRIVPYEVDVFRSASEI